MANFLFATLLADVMLWKRDDVSAVLDRDTTKP
jgi:hypothetical protein